MWRLDAQAEARHVEPGISVTLQNLSSTPELNGKAGLCTAGPDANGRVGVRVANKNLSVKLCKIRIAQRHIAACLVATHISSIARVETLRHCLRSIKGQSQTPWICLSWSAATIELADAVESMLTSERIFSGVSTEGICLRQEARLSQFEHYQYLARRLAQEASELSKSQRVQTVVWCLFGDDDDVWHPMRLEFYCLLLGQMDGEQRSSSQAITCGWYAVRSGRKASLQAATSAAEVETLLQRGEWRVKSSEDDKQQQQKKKTATTDGAGGSDSGVEHWASMLRLDRLMAFYSIAPAGLIASEFCDVPFAKWFGKAAPDEDPIMCTNVAHNPQFPWLYGCTRSAWHGSGSGVLCPCPLSTPVNGRATVTRKASVSHGACLSCVWQTTPQTSWTLRPTC